MSNQEQENMISQPAKKPRRPWPNIIHGLFTDESFLGVSALTILGGVALYKNLPEIAGIALGGIAGLLKNRTGKDE